MDVKKFIVGTATGGIVYFFLGFVFYAILFEDFFMANQGSATGVWKSDTEMQYWPIVLGNMSWAALLTYIIQKWAKAGSIKGGAKVGAIVGLLTSFGYAMIQYDTTNISNMTAAFGDVFINLTMGAVAGGIIALVAAGSGE